MIEPREVYISPELEIVAFSTTDVITTSDNVDFDGWT